MIDAVRVSTLEDDEKCRFLFEMFDVEHRGVLSKEGVRAFIEATFAANGVEFLGKFDYDTVVEKVFDQCRQHDKMTYSEFKTIFADVVVEGDDNKYRDALGKMSTVMETQRQKEIAHNNEQGGRWYRTKKFGRKYKAEIFWLTLYFALMVGVFIAKASRFPFDPAVGNCPRIAKGFAEICLVNTMFVLLPMCRNFVTGLRTLPVVVNHLPIDNHIEFHKICGVVLLIASLGHTAAWLAIVIYVRTVPLAIWEASRYHMAIVIYVRTVPLAIWEASRYHYLTFVRDENLLLFALRVPIWTGVIMLICAAIAAPLCLEKVRRGNFNLFWVTHMLFLPFLVLMAFHGFARWVAAPQAQYWILPPVVIFLVEKRYRMTQMFGGQTKIAHVQLSKEAVAIFMKKPKSFNKRQRFLPGMYVFINVPTISRFEWHPFTISSAPEDKFLSLHIQNAGDWTGALYKRLEMLQKLHETSAVEDQGNPRTSPYPAVYLDGPVGAPAQDYSRYREVVLIGAGIGVTPFASILRSIMHQWESYRCPQCKHVRFPPSFQLRKIYFYWVTREQESLTWFTNTMNQLSEMDTENRLEIHNFFSSVKTNTLWPT
ncbi:Respiratory burst oxidase [Phytophthora palmivora]|uniref:Respiratory burst oxidase n=1 Tax=Phytophthora palmivora TaxID=4796 RepID=A0A2P4Y5P8_9STRA|nr:Respiratory burst oxidase [Phytophthora palmivora]